MWSAECRLAMTDAWTSCVRGRCLTMWVSLDPVELSCCNYFTHFVIVLMLLLGIQLMKILALSPIVFLAEFIVIIVSWNHCITREWLQWMARIHRSAVGIDSPLSNPICSAIFLLGNLKNVSSCCQGAIQVKCQFDIEVRIFIEPGYLPDTALCHLTIRSKRNDRPVSGGEHWSHAYLIKMSLKCIYSIVVVMQ